VVSRDKGKSKIANLKSKFYRSTWVLREKCMQIMGYGKEILTVTLFAFTGRELTVSRTDRDEQTQEEKKAKRAVPSVPD
jgi:hypothetical protein